MDQHFDPHADLLHEHVEGVRRLARHLVQDPDDAEDVAQESLLAAVGRLPPGVRSLPAWLRGVVRNKTLQRGRAEGRRARHVGRLPPSGESAATSDVVAQLEVQRQLVAAVQALPAAYRTVLWFRYFEGVSAQEIASRLDAPVETVRTRIKRGLRQLRADLDARHEGQRSAWTAALLPMLAPGGGWTAALGILTGKATLFAGLAVAILVTTGVLLVSARKRDPAGDRVVETGALTRSDPETAPPRLAGRATLPPAGLVASPDAGGHGRTRIQGRVLTQDRKSIEAALVSIVEGPGMQGSKGPNPPWRLLGQATSDARGRYGIDLDRRHPARPGAPGVVLAVAEADGYWRGRQLVEIEGPLTSFDFFLGTGWEVAGQVLDARGRPLVDLPLRVATMSAPPHMVHTSLWWTRHRRLGTESGNYLEARTRTDASGRFVVRGLETGRRYGILSEDLAWFLRQNALVKIEAGVETPPVTLLAVPARAVRGTVSDASTGKPLAKGLVELMLRTPDGNSVGSYVSVREGRFLAGWKLDEERQGRVEVTATASASGYKHARMTGSLSSEEPVLDLDLALEPILEEHGTVVLTATGPRGAPLPGFVFLWAQQQEDHRVRLRRRPERVRPGVFRFDLPAGTYDAEMRPLHVLGEQGKAVFEVRVVPDQVTDVRVEVGAGATLRLRLPLVDEVPSPSGLVIDAVGDKAHSIAGASTDLTLQEAQVLAGEDLVWAAFLPGTWRLELQWGEERIERTVHLVEGDDQVVSFR